MNKTEQLRQQFTGDLIPLGAHWRHCAQAALEPYGLSLLASNALLNMARLGEGVSQRELAEAMDIDAATMVRTLHCLTEAGLVRRQVGDDDQRVRTLWFTDAGRAMPHRIQEALGRAREQVLAKADQADLEAALRVFRLMEQATLSSPSGAD